MSKYLISFETPSKKLIEGPIIGFPIREDKVGAITIALCTVLS